MALACGMNARGSAEVIVASIGLSMGVLSQDPFIMIVAMAVITTMAMPPMLRWALAHVPLGEEQRRRLEREELDAKGFVTNLERLLLAADDSSNGKLASHVAGLIAGSGGKPTTIVNLSRTFEFQRPTAAAAVHEGTVRDAAQSISPLDSHPDEPEKGALTSLLAVRRIGRRTSWSLIKRARDDLLVIGIESTRSPTGGFTDEVTRIANGYSGPIAILLPRGGGPMPFDRSLVPINGSEASRRAAEVAFVIGRSKPSRVTTLYVTRKSAEARRRRERGGWTRGGPRRRCSKVFYRWRRIYIGPEYRSRYELM